MAKITAKNKYALDDFDFRPVEVTKPARKVKPSVSIADGSGNDLAPIPLPEDRTRVLPSDPNWVEAIVTGNPPAHKNYGSRSEFVFGAVIWMVSNKVDPRHVLSILLDREMGISAHVHDQPDALAYARRQVEQAQGSVKLKQQDWPLVNDHGLPIREAPENIRYAFAQLGIRAQRNMFVQANEFEGLDLGNRDLNDIADILCSVFGRELHFSTSVASIKRELITIAHENRYHPVIEYLEGLKWDGVERLDQWLIDYAGAADTELNRAFARKLLIAGVRRIKRPGVKYDNMLVLEGGQGVGKSRLAAALAIRSEWFCDSLDLQSDDKTKAEILQRAWIIECQELDGMNKATSQKLKKFLSSPTDTYRKAYAHDASQNQRHCIIIGTTNEDTYLRDPTGNRRFWPVQVSKIDLEGFGEVVDQLWAEAAKYEAEGEELSLPQALWKDAEAVQSRRMMEDPFSDVLEPVFADKKGRVSLETVKTLLGLQTSRMNPYDARRVKAAMAALGWDYGSHKLHDPALVEQITRRGFASGSGDEAKSEFIIDWLPNGKFRVMVLGDNEEPEYPF